MSCRAKRINSYRRPSRRLISWNRCAGLAQLLVLLGQSPSLLSNTYDNQGNRQPHTKDRKAADHRRQVRNLANFIPS